MTAMKHLLLFVAVALTGCMTKPVDVMPVRPVQYALAPTPAETGGSLFMAARYRPAFEDPRARMPGDTLTIQITEKVAASSRPRPTSTAPAAPRARSRPSRA